jgi:hypothetical protein
MESRVQQAAREYNRARAALQRLDAADSKFKEITKADLKMPSDVVEENRIGQRSDTLAWFWRLDNIVEGEEQSTRMKECMQINLS